MTIGKAMSSYDKMKLTDKYTFSKDWLSDNPEYLIIWHMSSSLRAGLKEFYCTLN
jgi:hypothetical protein